VKIIYDIVNNIKKVWIEEGEDLKWN